MRSAEAAHLRRWPASVALLAVLLGGCGGTQASRSAIADLADSLRSHAAEGALLAGDAAVGRATQVFTIEHAADLLALASQVEASLGSVQADPSLEPELDRLRDAAVRVTDDLRQIGEAGVDLTAVSADLQAAADEIQSMGAALS
jgi:hypothetical protein